MTPTKTKNKFWTTFKDEVVRTVILFLIMCLINRMFENTYDIGKYLIDLVPASVYGIVMLIRDIVRIKLLYIETQIVNKKTGDPCSYAYQNSKTSDRTLTVKLNMSLNRCIIKPIIYKLLDINNLFITIIIDDAFSTISIQPIKMESYIEKYSNGFRINIKPIVDNFCAQANNESEIIALEYSCTFNFNRDENINKETCRIHMQLDYSDISHPINSFCKRFLFKLTEIENGHEIRIRE